MIDKEPNSTRHGEKASFIQKRKMVTYLFSPTCDYGYASRQYFFYSRYEVETRKSHVKVLTVFNFT